MFGYIQQITDIKEAVKLNWEMVGTYSLYPLGIHRKLNLILCTKNPNLSITYILAFYVFFVTKKFCTFNLQVSDSRRVLI